MNPKRKKEWITALESGEFKQGKDTLRSTNNEYCCLGVACELYRRVHPTTSQWRVVGFPPSAYRFEVLEKEGGNVIHYDFNVLVPEVMAWLGLEDANPIVIADNISKGCMLSLAGMNDQGTKFPEIAGAIKKALKNRKLSNILKPIKPNV